MRIYNPASVAEVVYARMTLPSIIAAGRSGTFGVNNNNVWDANTGSLAAATAIDQYSQLDLVGASQITQFRHFGNVGNNADGEWRVQYRDAAGTWVDWVTGIVTRATADWSGWDATGGIVTASAVRIVCTIVDTGSGGQSRINELEIIY